MESKNIALSDAERNKELFEYEMTQVILQLKGEFAKVSGKDIGLDAEQLTAPQISVPESIATVSMMPSANNDIVDVPTVDGCHQIPTVQLGETDISCPTVPVPSMTTIPNVRVAKTELDCPTVPIINGIQTKEVTITLPNMTIDLPQPGSASISDVRLNSPKPTEISTEIEIPSGKFEVQVDPISFAVPDTEIQLPTVSDVHLDTARYNVPQVDVAQPYVPMAVKVEPVAQIAIPVAPVVSFKTDLVKMSVPVPSIDVTVPQPNQYSPVTVDTNDYGITEVHTPQIKGYQPCAVQIERTMVNTPIQEISISEIEPLDLTGFTSDIAVVDVPEITKNPVANTTVNVQMPSFKTEIPTIPTGDIPTVIISKSNEITIPNAPDVTADIEIILKSVMSVSK